MAAYAPHDILRRIDNALIAEYAAAKGLFPDLEIGALKQTDIQPVYQAMQALDATTKEAFERDLRNVGHVVMTCVAAALFILSLSYVTASGFNPFIYFRF